MKLYSVTRGDEERKNRWSFIPYSPSLLPCRVGLRFWQVPQRPKGKGLIGKKGLMVNPLNGGITKPKT